MTGFAPEPTRVNELLDLLEDAHDELSVTSPLARILASAFGHERDPVRAVLREIRVLTTQLEQLYDCTTIDEGHVRDVVGLIDAKSTAMRVLLARQDEEATFAGESHATERAREREERESAGRSGVAASSELEAPAETETEQMQRLHRQFEENKRRSDPTGEKARAHAQFVREAVARRDALRASPRHGLHVVS